MSDLTELVIARHGEAYINVDAQHRLDGVCTGLTERGRSQADRLGLRVAAEMAGPRPFHVICHSPVRRCLETAVRILHALPPRSMPTEELDGLRTSDHGEPGRDPWDTSTNDIGTVPPLAPHSAPTPGAETWQAYLDRSSRALLEIADRYEGRRVLIVAHSETAGSAMQAFYRLPPGHSRHAFPVVHHTALTCWRRMRSTMPGIDGRGQWQLVSANDDTHVPDTLRSGLGL